MDQPTPGRIIWYTNLGDKDGKYPPQIVPAMITLINADDTVALKAFYPTGIFDMPSVSKTDAQPGSDEARGKWNWPERSNG
jgi:hypothetical protein